LSLAEAFVYKYLHCGKNFGGTNLGSGRGQTSAGARAINLLYPGT
jgi:hypothetical protein